MNSIPILLDGGAMLGGVRVGESPFVPVGQVIRSLDPGGYPMFHVNPYNRYGERAGVHELGRKSPFYTRHSAGVIEAARDRRHRGKRYPH